MKSPESSSNDIKNVKPYTIVDSIVPPLGLPILESGRYVLDMRMNRSWSEQLYGQDEVRFTDNQEEVARRLASAASTLAWVQFFAKPEITIRHSPLALENGQHHHVAWRDNFPLETLTGERFSAGEGRYVVNYDLATGAEFKSYSQIVKDGELTPYMEEWLTRVLSNKNNHHPAETHLLPFAKWLQAKRPNDDFYKKF